MVNLKEQLTTLIQVQELDLKIDGLLLQKKKLPEQLQDLQTQQRTLQTEIKAKQNAIAEFQKTERHAQAALELNHDRVARANQKLEGVQNSQEFQSANKEIEQLKRFALGLEEQIAKVRAEVQIVETQLSALTDRMAGINAEHDQKDSEVGAKSSEFDSELEKLKGERNQYIVKVEKTTLARYDRVRQAKAGIGIAAAQGGRCTACHMILPPQLFNQVLQGKEPHSCPSCHRILFIPESK